MDGEGRLAGQSEADEDQAHHHRSLDLSTSRPPPISPAGGNTLDYNVINICSILLPWDPYAYGSEPFYLTHEHFHCQREVGVEQTHHLYKGRP